MGAQEGDHCATEGLNDQPVFFGAEFALFRELTENGAVQFIMNAANAPSGYVLFCNVAAILYFMHDAGKRGRAADAALFQHADEGRLRVVRLQVAQVHAGLQLVVFYARVGDNGLKQRPTRGG